MHYSSLLLLPLAALTARVAGNACVVGGPAPRVDNGERCCGLAAGKWFSKYDYQGICVLTELGQDYYEKCIARFSPNYNLVCIVSLPQAFREPKDRH
jgi:hypothetical protein